MKTTNKVAIYVRVSTTSQVEEGYSIDEQKFGCFQLWVSAEKSAVNLIGFPL